MKLLAGAADLDLAPLWAEGDDLGAGEAGPGPAGAAVALPLRAARSGRAAGTYGPLLATGPAAEHGVAFCRGGDVVTVVTRWPLALEAAGGWRNTHWACPPGAGRTSWAGAAGAGDVKLRNLLAGLPVALLERAEA